MDNNFLIVQPNQMQLVLPFLFPFRGVPWTQHLSEARPTPKRDYSKSKNDHNARFVVFEMVTKKNSGVSI